ncbi:MAG: sulfotransferase [Halioglobus sp.]|nr:sulfotransferase [Halioglobus sp.]|tara:strand:- start:445 stop:2112 length:1668 start_codon:yes stop_codon:yes gene_type:complete
MQYNAPKPPGSPRLKSTVPDIDNAHRAAVTALRDGRLRDAHQLCLQILQADRRHADAWFICGVIAGQNRQHAKAVQVLHNACSLAPRRAEYRAELAKYQVALGRPRQALESARAAASPMPRSSATLNTLGGVFSHCGEHARAIDCYRAAVAKLEADADSEAGPAERAELYFNLAVSLQFAGQQEEAERRFEQAIALRPDYFKAHSALATLRRQTPQHNHLPRLEALRGSARSAADRLHLGHALAREYEDLGEPARAMDCLDWAKREQRAAVAYDFAAQRRVFDSLKSTFDANSLAPAAAGCASEEPIFIVGMPRSGTSLVEQILGSHSQVFAAGELPQFPQQVAQLVAGGDGAPAAAELDAASVAAAARIDPAELGRAYLEATRPRTGHTPRFTDKLPRNFLYLGLIHRALPRARIICLRRDPMDTCLSNYRQLFAVRAPHYYYNLDLQTCGRYFIEFDRLISHWREALPGAVYELSYEALVEDPPTQVAALLAHCGLPWEERCLQFHRRDNAVATPSAAQVKQAIYRTSVGRWRQYGDAVQPLYELLREAGYYA